MPPGVVEVDEVGGEEEKQIGEIVEFFLLYSGTVSIQELNPSSCWP